MNLETTDLGCQIWRRRRRRTLRNFLGRNNFQRAEARSFHAKHRICLWQTELGNDNIGIRGISNCQRGDTSQQSWYSCYDRSFSFPSRPWLNRVHFFSQPTTWTIHHQAWPFFGPCSSFSNSAVSGRCSISLRRSENWESCIERLIEVEQTRIWKLFFGSQISFANRREGLCLSMLCEYSKTLSLIFTILDSHAFASWNANTKPTTYQSRNKVSRSTISTKTV